MDQDDAEERIADLERQLAERQRGAGLPPASADAAAASGRFTGYEWVGPRAVNMPTPLRPFAICVTTHGMTVDLRPGELFAFRDAQLGLWVHGSMTMGTALHLPCGANRLVIGGRDYRVATDPRLEAAPVDRVDVWMWASDFYALLSGIGSRSGVDVSGAAPGEPTRCWLVSISTMMHTSPSDTLAFNFTPSLAIDVGNDAIWVMDLTTNTLVASAWLAQVTATPSQRSYGGMSWSRGPAPVLVVCVPGVQPLSIGCLDRGANGPQSSYRPQGRYRLSWRGAVPTEKAETCLLGLGRGLADARCEIRLGPESGRTTLDDEDLRRSCAARTAADATTQPTPGPNSSLARRSDLFSLPLVGVPR